MQIKEFAARTGVSRDTIRFYEKRGLLKPASRNGSNGYRHYSEDEVELMRQIQIGQALGFSLAEIKKGAEAWRVGVFGDDLQIAMMEAKLVDLDRKLAELSRISFYLREKIRWIKEGKRGPGPELA